MVRGMSRGAIRIEIWLRSDEEMYITIGEISSWSDSKWKSLTMPMIRPLRRPYSNPWSTASPGDRPTYPPGRRLVDDEGLGCVGPHLSREISAGGRFRSRTSGYSRSRRADWRCGSRGTASPRRRGGDLGGVEKPADGNLFAADMERISGFWRRRVLKPSRFWMIAGLLGRTMTCSLSKPRLFVRMNCSWPETTPTPMMRAMEIANWKTTRALRDERPFLPASTIPLRTRTGRKAERKRAG